VPPVVRLATRSSIDPFGAIAPFVPERNIGLHSRFRSIDKSAKSVISGFNGAFDTPLALTTGITRTLGTAIDKPSLKVANSRSQFLILKPRFAKAP
jgi:hypothetical protein